LSDLAADIPLGLFGEVPGMRWKSVVLAGALSPTLTGCNIYYYAARNLINEPQVVGSLVGIEHQLRKEAKAAWREVREQYPRNAFTAEFRDGFLDGYVDYLDHGGNGSTVAVPPPRYTRQKKYFTEEGQCLMRHYLLGFQYGQNVAIATGRRALFTVPVLLPEQPKGPPAFLVQPHDTTIPPLMNPPQQPPAVTARPNPGPPGEQTSRPAVPATPQLVSREQLPVAAPPAPAAYESSGEAIPPVLPFKLPAPPSEIPLLPDHIPTPSVLDDLPVVPPSHTLPAPVPPSHTAPTPVLPNHPDPTGGN
jgi:hypothetical protein